MSVSCSLGSLLSIQNVLSCAKILSNTNVNTIWIPETWGMENFAMLSSVSSMTSAPRIGSSIINVYSRSPAAIAMGAATVDTISGGRLILGLGVSSNAIVSGLHGVSYQSPLTRIKETVEIINLATSGKKINYDGKIFKLHGFDLLIQPVRKKIPIYLAAVNKKMTRLAWDVADGVIFYLRPIEEIKRIINQMNNESDNKNIDVACQLITCVSDDSTNEMYAINRVRRTISFYIAVGKVYRDFLAANGFANETEKIYTEFKHAGLNNIHRHVTDEMVDALAIAGTPKVCRKKLDAFRNAGITHPILQFNPIDNDIAHSFDVFVDTFFGELQ